MKQEIIPTDPEAEIEKGRLALWLDPEDILWLARHLAEYDESPEETERCGRIRFRALTALHKAGLPNDPWSEDDE